MRKLEKNIMQGTFQIPPGVSELASRLIKKILQQNPNNRPSAMEILNDEWFVKIGIAKQVPMLQRSLSQSRDQISRHVQDEIQASRRNMSANRRDDLAINTQQTFDQPSPRYENFSPAQANPQDQGKFFTKKTVANKSNVKI